MENPNSRRSWLWVLVLAAFLSQTTIQLVRPTTTYKLLALDADGFAVGLVSSIYALLPLVLVLYLGARAQVVRSLKPLLVIGSMTVVVGAAGVAIAGSVAVIAISSGVLGLGQIIFTVAGQAAVARYSSNDQLDSGFGWFTAGFSGGQLLGPLLGGVIVDGAFTQGAESPSLRAIDSAVWVAVLFALAALAVVQFCSAALRKREGAAGATNEKRAGETSDKADCPAAWNILRIRGVKSYMVASITILAMVDISTAFLPLLGEEVGVSPSLVGILLAVRAGASLVSRLLLSQLRKRFSRYALVLASLLGSGATFTGTVMVFDNPLLASLAIAAAGFFLGLGQPLSMSMITMAVRPKWRSTALALRLMGNRFGQVSLPLVAGAVATSAGPGASIWMASALLGASGVQIAWTQRRGGTDGTTPGNT